MKLDQKIWFITNLAKRCEACDHILPEGILTVWEGIISEISVMNRSERTQGPVWRTNGPLEAISYRVLPVDLEGRVEKYSVSVGSMYETKEEAEEALRKEENERQSNQ